MIRLKRLLTEGVYVNEHTIPLDDVTRVGFPAIFMNMEYNNPYHLWVQTKGDPQLQLAIKLNGKFKSLFGVSITGLREKQPYSQDGWVNSGFRYTLELSGGSNNYYYEYWSEDQMRKWDDSRPKGVKITEDDRSIVPTHWQLHLAGKTSGGQSSEIIIKSVSSQDIKIGHYTQVVRGYDRDYEYEKHADGYGETNYYVKPKGGSLTRLKPGTEAYTAVKTKVFKDI